MTIYDYFDRLTSIGLDEEISEEFDNKIIDALEIIRNHEIGDFENVIDDEPRDDELRREYFLRNIKSINKKGHHLMMPTYSERSHSPIMLENHKILILNIIKLKTIIKLTRSIKMRKENKEYLYDLLQERLSLLDERTEQEWEDAADPKGEEMIILTETIGYLNDLFD